MHSNHTRQRIILRILCDLMALILTSFISHTALAQDSLIDLNGDGLITILAFGDSITYGVGDGVAPGVVAQDVPVSDGTVGYPQRLGALLGVAVVNAGVPGEEFAVDGFARFPQALAASAADTVILMEGANDAVHQLDPGEYRRLLQRVVNVARVQGRAVLLATLPPPCCDHAPLSLFTGAYSGAVKRVAALNDLRVIDMQRAWVTTCSSLGQCDLYNLPEGLHPNTKGYDVIAQNSASAIYGIDIFSADGASNLEAALGLPAGTVVVKPDGVAVP